MRFATRPEDDKLGGAGGRLDKRINPAVRRGSGEQDDGGSLPIQDPLDAPVGLLGAIVAGSPAGLAVLDVEGRLALVNAAFCRLLDLPRDALLGARLEEVLGRERQAARDALEHLESAPRYTFTARAAETRRWLRIEVARIHVGRCAATVAAADADAVKRLELELERMRERHERLEMLHRVEAEAHRDSERRLQFALDAARMGTWTWDPVADIAFHDDRARQILDGVVGEGTLAKAMERHLPPEDIERYAKGLKRILDPHSSEHHFEAELPWRRRDGSPSWILMTGEAHFEGEGGERRPTVVTGTVVDITRRKLAEIALAEASRQKDRFLATLAHELRNPLAPLYYAVDLLESDAREEVDWARGVIERQVSHLTRLIDDLLDISRIGRGQLEVRREPIAIEEVVRNAVESTRGTLKEHGQELDVRLPSEPIVVRGDPVRLTQVVTNFLTNAAKFSQRPGRVVLSAEREDGSNVCLSVEDSGIGIAADDLPHLFEMFYRGGRALDRPYGGLGVGLYLVRSLVELHGGSVGAESGGEGQGARFTVRLPIDATAIEETPKRGAKTPGASRPRRRVLIVDDNRDAADALAKLLRAGGDEVATAYEGLAALDAAERLKPEVVLLDLGMPTIDGYEVCRRMRAQPWGKDILMVALTGWGRPEDRDRTREAGFDEHLVKPVDVGDVESVLHKPRAPRRPPDAKPGGEEPPDGKPVDDTE